MLHICKLSSAMQYVWTIHRMRRCALRGASVAPHSLWRTWRVCSW